jgi:hypothetical protein
LDFWEENSKPMIGKFLKEGIGVRLISMSNLSFQIFRHPDFIKGYFE